MSTREITCIVQGLPVVIVRSEDHGTITLRASHLAIDVTLRPDTMKRAGWHTVIDDDPQGVGCQTRMHLYGRERLLELKALVDRAVEETEGRDGPPESAIEETEYGLVSGEMSVSFLSGGSICFQDDSHEPPAMMWWDAEETDRAIGLLQRARERGRDK